MRASSNTLTTLSGVRGIIPQGSSWLEISMLPAPLSFLSQFGQQNSDAFVGSCSAGDPTIGSIIALAQGRKPHVETG